MHHASPSPQSRWTARRLTVWGTGLLVLSWFIYAYTMSTPGLIDRAGRFKGTDHIYFFVMGSLMEDGRADDLYSPDAHLAEGRRRIDPSLALYAPYSNYGPQIAWAFKPLARLSYAGSLTLFLLFTAGCYAPAVGLIWRDLPELARYGPLVAVLAAASPLFLSLFRYAQLSAITLLLYSLALAAIRRDRRFLAGIALGTMIFKPTLGVLVGITLIAAGEWRIVAGAAAAATAQIALAWLLAHKPWIVPIPGTSKIDHLNENLAAVNVQLTPADLRELETEFSKVKVHGGRMNEMQMQVVDQTSK